MRNAIARRKYLVALIAGVSLLFMVPPVDADGGASGRTESFTRRGPDVVSPSGHSVLADCGPTGDGNTDGWLDAKADLRINQVGGRSQITIKVRDARPNTLYTVWLRLGGTDSEGQPFGTNPLTGGRATPLAATSELPALLATAGPGNGSDQQPHGFHTNRKGAARFRTTVDFPIHGGAYPFQRFEGFDPTDPRLPAAEPAIYPVAIAGPQGPFTLRIISHCTDGLGHGLQSGPREWWFDWTVDR